MFLEKMFFSWGRAEQNKNEQIRTNYLKAKRQADKGEIQPFIDFAI